MTRRSWRDPRKRGKGTAPPRQVPPLAGSRRGTGRPGFGNGGPRRGPQSARGGESFPGLRQSCLGRGDVVLVVGQPACASERSGPCGQVHIVEGFGDASRRFSQSSLPPNSHDDARSARARRPTAAHSPRCRLFRPRQLYAGSRALLGVVPATPVAALCATVARPFRRGPGSTRREHLGPSFPRRSSTSCSSANSRTVSNMAYRDTPPGSSSCWSRLWSTSAAISSTTSTSGLPSGPPLPQPPPR